MYQRRAFLQPQITVFDGKPTTARRRPGRDGERPYASVPQHHRECFGLPGLGPQKHSDPDLAKIVGLLSRR